MFETSEYVLRSLIEDKRISEEDAARAVEASSADGSSLEGTLVRMGLVSARNLALAKAMICEYPFVDLDSFEAEIENCQLLSREFAESHGVFPLFVFDKVATVAMLDPLNLIAIDGLSQALRVEIDPVIADADRLNSLIRRAYSLVSVRGDEPSTTMDAVIEDALDSEPIVAAVNQILDAAVTAGASDVHMCPDEDTLHLRFRIDGVLETQQGPDLTTHSSIVQRLKVMAELDVTQTRRPQDGKFRFSHKSSPIDVRLSLLPTIHGENAVLRLLRPGKSIGTLNDLRMPTKVHDEFEGSISQPHGLVLVTGPTGSGKTTTLYTALARLNTPDRNVMTIEDPVEIRLPWVRQIQANPEVGLTFAAALRSILRQDPDVVLVGEIRDQETARIAVQASLTGHLVFATLHTNDAVGSLARLSDFEIEPFAINSSLLGTLAQRLIRRVCPACARPDQAEARVLAQVGLDATAAASLVRGEGCAKCRSTGYAGRLGVYEYMLLTGPLQEMIERGESIRAIREAARSGGMQTLLDHGIEKALAGETSIDELSKLVTMEMVKAEPEGGA